MKFYAFSAVVGATILMLPVSIEKSIGCGCVFLNCIKRNLIRITTTVTLTSVAMAKTKLLRSEVRNK